MSRKNIITAIVTVVVAALVVWYFTMDVKVEPNTQHNGNAAPAAPEATSTTQSLGAQIYSQSNNPIPTNLPATNPVQNSNPIQGLYTNPF